MDNDTPMSEKGAAIIKENPVTVLLSRKNLMTLLLKLDRRRNGERTHCTLIKQDLNNVNIPVVITAEEDAEVYKNRSPGRMVTQEEAKFLDPKADAMPPVNEADGDRVHPRDRMDARDRFKKKAADDVAQLKNTSASRPVYSDQRERRVTAERRQNYGTPGPRRLFQEERRKTLTPRRAANMVNNRRLGERRQQVRKTAFPNRRGFLDRRKRV